LSAFVFPFVGRQKEMARLCEVHAERKHALILGPAGVGKSALVGQARERLSLLVSARSAHLGEICEGLEPQLGLEPAGLRLLQRKQRVREAEGLWRCGTGHSAVFGGGDPPAGGAGERDYAGADAREMMDTLVMRSLGRWARAEGGDDWVRPAPPVCSGYHPTDTASRQRQIKSLRNSCRKKRAAGKGKRLTAKG